MVSDWALTAFDGGVQVNYYGPCRMETALPCGGILTLRQETSYPADGNIRITLGTDRRAKFPLMLRIPGWSRNTRVWVNGEEAAAAPGYLYLEREWQTGDVIELQLDMSLHAWTGQRACAGKVSVYRGPLLMAYDRRFGSWDTDSLPEVVSVENVPVYPDGEWPEPVVMLKAQTTAGEMLLCDYATAGAWGTPYASWLPMKRAPQMFKKGEPEWFSAL